MRIQKQRIRNPNRYLRTIKSGESFVVAFRDPATTKERAVLAGFSDELPVGQQVLPSPVGNVTFFNANGRYIALKDQPKETAYRQQEWTWHEWRGPYDTEERTEIVEIPYERYPRRFIEPPSIEFSIAADENGNKVIASPTFVKDSTDADTVTTAINVLLELFGECEILDEKLAPIIRSPVKRVNWELLPRGPMPWNQMRRNLRSVIDSQTEGRQAVIAKRFEAINSHGPEFAATGKAGFQGYIVLGFPSRNLYVLESTEVNNATYILENDWETLSQMTKAELLREGLHKHRVVHRKNWFREIHNILCE